MTSFSEQPTTDAAGSSQPLPSPRPGVIYRSLEEGGVLFSVEDEVYFGLNVVGAQVWELLPPASRTFGELLASLSATYPEVDAAVIRADVQELLEALRAHGLVVDSAA